MGKLADCERIVQEAIDGLGGLDVIISNAVCSTVHLFKLWDASDHKYCNTTALSDIQRAGPNSRNSVTLTLSVKLNGIRY